MAKKITEIYEEYKIMPFLQDHMFRVAAVGSMVCDSIDLNIDKRFIVLACLVHDMGNIIKAQLDYFPEAIQPEGLEYWQKIKDEYLSKYGDNEHKATAEIIKEIGLDDRIISIVDRIDFNLYSEVCDSSDFSNKIVVYADARVDPHGIVSFQDRMEEGKNRYKKRNSTFGGVSEEERKRLVESGRKIEQQIFSHCKIKPEDINNQSVAPIIKELKNFVIE